MNTNLNRFLLVLAGFWCATASPGVETVFQLPREEIRIKETPGAQLVKANCVLCHSVDYITTQPVLTRAQWTATVEKMRAKYGAPLVTNSVPEILDYLTRNYGREVSLKR